MSRVTPSYEGLSPASARASAAARGSSRKSDTRCERALRKELWKAGLRYRKNVGSLPGKPGIVFVGPKVAVFCDGDFWHGRGWEAQRKKLLRGTNPEYWLRKIETNMARDSKNRSELEDRTLVVLCDRCHQKVHWVGRPGREFSSLSRSRFRIRRMGLLRPRLPKLKDRPCYSPSPRPSDLDR